MSRKNSDITGGIEAKKPEILAPAGNRSSFYAAVSAGADAIYCGLKTHSARMAAKNFTVDEMAKLVALGRKRGVKIYVAFNTMLGPSDLNPSFSLIRQLAKHVKPDALIIQDPAVVELARQADFAGEIHLSTLANVSFPRALSILHSRLGVHRVVVPRELNIDEIRAMADACPPGLMLETFVHGALCYAVSGRCYWSSHLGGKSGLTGKCVQPCRRAYAQGENRKKYFSCQDLSLDVLVKVLAGIPRIGAWKIEGRKKGPHYVYYTVSAYRMLRDEGHDPKIKKAALGLLERALGRGGTHYFFLPQRRFNPVDTDRQTASGLFIGKTGGPAGKPFVIPNEALLPGDVLRVGYEDETWHATCRIRKYVPKRGRYTLKIPRGKGPAGGTPVFLTDRKEKELQSLINEFEDEMAGIPEVSVEMDSVPLKLPGKSRAGVKVSEMSVFRNRIESRGMKEPALWLSHRTAAGFSGDKRIWWWLPPVIWPEDEAAFARLIRKSLDAGEKQFVLNAPWQLGFFDGEHKCRVWAGPFCNVANPLAVAQMKKMGFSGVIVSPELAKDDYAALPVHSPLPLGIVISGNWPLCISRSVSGDLEMERLFYSPRQEGAWAASRGANVWVYPNWQLDIQAERDKLARAGYRLFVNLIEPVPGNVRIKKRPGKWNWDLKMSAAR